jgi:hypothetical protein
MIGLFMLIEWLLLMFLVKMSESLGVEVSGSLDDRFCFVAFLFFRLPNARCYMFPFKRAWNRPSPDV